MIRDGGRALAAGLIKMRRSTARHLITFGLLWLPGQLPRSALRLPPAFQSQSGQHQRIDTKSRPGPPTGYPNSRGELFVDDEPQTKRVAAFGLSRPLSSAARLPRDSGNTGGSAEHCPSREWPGILCSFAAKMLTCTSTIRTRTDRVEAYEAPAAAAKARARTREPKFPQAAQTSKSFGLPVSTPRLTSCWKPKPQIDLQLKI